MKTTFAILTTMLLLLSSVPAMPQSTNHPNCQSANSDSDGDGWGWENNATCIVVDSSTNTPTNEQPNTTTVSQSGGDTNYCQSADSDSDGDGWGWENNQSCRVRSDSVTVELIDPTNDNSAPFNGTPFCQSANSDSDGDGWGWENNASCIVLDNPEPEPVSVPSPIVPSPIVPSPIVPSSSDCLADSATSLIQCLSSGQDVRLTANISCSGCSFTIRDGELDGDGYTITRNSGQMNSNLIRGIGSGYSIENLTLDEGNGEVCVVGQNCPRTVQLTGNDISISNVTVRNSKAYTFAIDRANNVDIEGLTLIDGGIVGLIIENDSNNVSVDQSTFTRVGSNSIAVTGANNVIIENSVFTNNHLIGFFAVAPRFGTGFTGGGQVYLASGNNITFQNNTVIDGSCDNCVGDISGVELGFLNNEVMDNIVVINNNISNNTGPNIAVNRDVTLTNSVLGDQFFLSEGAVLNPVSPTVTQYHTLIIPDSTITPRGLSWADSYSYQNRCYISSSFDHGAGSLSIGGVNARTIAANQNAPVGINQADAIYNDINCGNGPPNTAGDEHICPGRVDQGREGCVIAGPNIADQL